MLVQNRFVRVAALGAMLVPLVACGGRSTLNAYLLNDANVAGDPAKSIRGIKGVLVWPLENIAAGSKSKGVETRFTGLFADLLTLRGSFERVVVLEEDQAKDLMTRAGEELGLKKKPKVPGEGALIATKLGQLTGTEVILTGRIEDYDEDKVDKGTFTVVQSSFNLIDAREKSYATLDSFTPVRRVWRTSIKRVSNEGPFNSRESIDSAYRQSLEDVIARMNRDLQSGVELSNRELQRKVSELNKAAEKSMSAREYDKAIAGWNEVLKLQPDNKKAKKGIESAEAAKVAAREKAQAAELKKQIEEIKGLAEADAAAGEPGKALEGWKRILELDKGNKEALRNIEKLEKQLAAPKAEEAGKKPAEPAKPAEAVKPAEPAKAAEPAKPAAAPAAPAKPAEAAKPAEPAKAAEPAKPAAAPAVPAATTKPAEAAKPAEPAKAAEPAKPAAAPAAPAAPAKPAEAAKPAEPAKAAEPAKPATAPAAPTKPAEAAKPAAGELDALRNKAMEAFNKEDYTASRDLWKQILQKSPDDKQAKEMLETTEMLLKALK